MSLETFCQIDEVDHYYSMSTEELITALDYAKDYESRELISGALFYKLGLEEPHEEEDIHQELLESQTGDCQGYMFEHD